MNSRTDSLNRCLDPLTVAVTSQAFTDLRQLWLNIFAVQNPKRIPDPTSYKDPCLEKDLSRARKDGSRGEVESAFVGLKSARQKNFVEGPLGGGLKAASVW